MWIFWTSSTLIHLLPLLFVLAQREFPVEHKKIEVALRFSEPSIATGSNKKKIDFQKFYTGMNHVIQKNLIDNGGDNAETKSKGLQHTKLNFSEAMKTISAFEKIWARVDSGLNYPDDLLEEHIDGTVALKVELTSQGDFSGRISFIEADNAVIESFVIAQVIAALQKPIEGVDLEREYTVFDLTVEFVASWHGNPIEPVQDPIRGTHFKFRKTRYVTDRVTQKIQKVFTRVIPPIFITPMGFYVDVVGLYTYIKNIGTPDPDDLREFRIEAERQHLKKFIRQKTENDQQGGDEKSPP